MRAVRMPRLAWVDSDLKTGVLRNGPKTKFDRSRLVGLHNP